MKRKGKSVCGDRDPCYQKQFKKRKGMRKQQMQSQSVCSGDEQ